MRLRYTLVQMAMDIEHYIKLDLLSRIESSSEDGYSICQDFINNLSEEQRVKFKNELQRNADNDYCQELVKKYDITNIPIWVLVELVPFGSFIYFYIFCGERFNDSKMKDMHFMLLSCRSVRNACAHSSCILNELQSDTATSSTKYAVNQSLSLINGLSSNTRRKRMSNARLQQIVTLLYVHKEVVTSSGVHSKACKALNELIARINKNRTYYDSNALISSSFGFLEKVIDNWFHDVKIIITLKIDSVDL